MVAPSDNTSTALPIVLVIDDERGPRESIRVLLKPDHHVLCAESVEEGVALLRQHNPDVVVMDIRMPFKNGIEGLRAIREIDTLVSIIMFTGFGALETAQEAMRLGANDYVKKPFDAFEMRRIIQQHILRTRKERSRKHVESTLLVMNKELKEELERKTHLASLGQKSAELVHDLRNPLSVIIGHVDLLLDQIRSQGGMASLKKEDAADYLETIEKSVLQCRDLSEMWLDISRGRLRCVPTDLQRTIRDILRSCQDKAEKLQVTLEAGSLDPNPVAVDPVQLGRAIQNLINNALEAAQSGRGRVRVWCTLQGDRVEVGVEDNGCGMSEEMIRQTAQPFFTTKRESGGTGLGLFIVRQVTEAHGGEFLIQSQPGQGTRITMTIPCRPS